MLSINYICNHLDNKQIRIDKSIYDKIPEFEINKEQIKDNNKIGKYHSKLPESFEILFNKSINDFYYDNKIFKNKSPVFTLINSIFNIVNELFDFYGEQEKEVQIKNFILKIDNDLFEKNLYTKFNYIKNRKFNKSSIQEVLKDSLQFKTHDKFNLLKEYLSDYLGANIYIFHIENNVINFLECEKYTPSYFGNSNNMILPNFLLIYENNIYKAILNYSNNKSYESSILDYSKYDVIIKNIWNYLKIEKINIISQEQENKNNIDDNNNNSEIKENTLPYKFSLNYLKDLKIDVIKKLCTENNIELLKKSDKTSKMINKLKSDLIEDLLKL
jgi:hypothetical protein